MTPTKITEAASIGGNCTVQYQTRRPVNCDGTKLFILEPGHCALYDAVTNQRLYDIPWLGDSNEPLWSRTEPSVFYYHLGNQLWRGIVTANGIARVPLRTFLEYAEISGLGESDISLDGNHVALAGDPREAFVYEFSTDTKSAALELQSNIDSLYLTASNWLITSYPDGMWLFDPSKNSSRQIANANGHKAVSVFQGEDVLIWTNSNENPVTLPDYPNGIVMIRLLDGPQVGLLSLDWSLAVDICCPAGADFAIVSTYSADPNSTVPYANAILKVPFDGSPVTELCKHGSDASKGYDAQPRAVSNGEKVWFNSNKDGLTNVYTFNLNSEGDHMGDGTSVIVYGQTVTLNDGANTSLADAMATIRKDDNWGDWEWVQGYIGEVIAAVQSSPELFQQYVDAESQLP